MIVFFFPPIHYILYQLSTPFQRDKDIKGFKIVTDLQVIVKVKFVYTAYLKQQNIGQFNLTLKSRKTEHNTQH